MNHEHPSNESSFWKSKSGIATCVFLAIAGIMLILEHRAHLLGWWPYLLLLACPLMHMFMHGGHGEHGHGRAKSKDPASRNGPGH